ncbi:pyruvate carboxylase [Pedosphaera parvula]|uniref:Pyruvate carboxylase n=1 Tax=Pedosphaera parvula (strain Ellin514) TaxID=320771 RepID=B9XH93_PEDPL|nr:pyruvate carboxylase [Pedosphaera parvula]EEF60728.1 pyruvate carboxylase [Pedosphaera parvula Ellin514]
MSSGKAKSSAPSETVNSPAKQFKKLLVANRSEIAIRVFRAATELGLRTVAIYAQEDKLSVHRFKADEAYLVGEGKGPVGAYLDIPSIVALAKEKGVDMIHPGYGFLSENAEFAKACKEAGITFVGPRPELLALMGDKTAARALADKVGVPTLPGTENPVEDRTEALKIAKDIGFPLIIKAAFGGGGRGMRVVTKSADLVDLLDEARNEAGRAFGNPAVFLEKYIPRAKHIEVQVMGDRFGNVLHLHERDCSVQRRHQKVIEIAPSVGLDVKVREELCEAASKIAREIGYDNAGTVEFLLDLDTNQWFFIEMNPRIQVEHTVTEVITGIDLVRAQILVAQGFNLFGPEIDMPKQADIPRNGYAVQCRITTEDPENKFTPDYGKIYTYRSAGGFGIRLDGGMGVAGNVITPFYDSLLVKVTASGRSFDIALQRTDRALREFRIRGVKTNIPFLENVIHNETFRSGKATTTLIDTTPELFLFKPRRDRATKLLAFLGDVVINGNPQSKGYVLKSALPTVTSPSYDQKQVPPSGTRQLLLGMGAKKFAEWTAKQKRLLITDTTFRDGHQSLLATRVRSFDMLAVANAVARRTPQLFSMEMWGGATFDTAMRFLHEDPWLRLRLLREKIPNICFQMLFRGSNAVGYSNYPDNVVAGFIKHAAAQGIDIFRIFDSLNYTPNLKVAMEAVQETHAICEAAICYTGDIIDPKRTKYSLKYYVKMAKELEKMGAHFLAIKDMAGLCRPYAAYQLVKALKEEIGIPIHYHTHDTSGVASASIMEANDAGVDVVDLALASMSGSTSQPNLNSIVAALQNGPRDTGLDLDALNEFSDYWEQVRAAYAPFDTAPKSGTAEVYLHEMPGGQYTNLKEQAASMGLGNRWPEIARTYAEVNQLFGDIVKVTPSSKVVGDMTMFLITRGIKPVDVVNLEPGATPFPESVIDMLMGGLGQPVGGWPKQVQKVVLGDRKPLKGRPGEDIPPLNFKKAKTELAAKLKRDVTDDDLYSSLMYPEVFQEFAKKVNSYSDLSVLPTGAFFYGLKLGEEIAVNIEEGKTLFIRLVNVSLVDAEGRRTILFELNGMPRQTIVQDRSVKSAVKARIKADPAVPTQVGAPIPGLITSLAVGVGTKVAKGDKLLVLEAMKMQTTIYAPCDGTVQDVHVKVGDTVESKDLLILIKA